jgi:hypothetical protein
MADEEEDDDFADDEEEEVEVDADDTTEAVASTDEEEEEAVAAPIRARKVEEAEVHSSAARAALRNTLAADVEAFLKRGGSIQQVATDDGDDAQPKKPDDHVGRRSV